MLLSRFSLIVTHLHKVHILYNGFSNCLHPTYEVIEQNNHSNNIICTTSSLTIIGAKDELYSANSNLLGRVLYVSIYNWNTIWNTL